MATIREVVLPHHKREDGTWNLRIRVTHKRRVTYIDTIHYVCEKQLKKDHTIKDPFLLTVINPVMDGYRRKISDLGEEKLETMDVKALVELLTHKELKAENINIIEFGWKRVEILDEEGRKGSRDNLKAVLYGLEDFIGSQVLPITEISSKMLFSYEKHLRTPRIVVRPDQFKIMRPRFTEGVTDGGLRNHMRDLRILFNAARSFYNCKEKGVYIIKHYPFENYKIVDTQESIKPKLTIEQVKMIRDIKVLTKEEVSDHLKKKKTDPEYSLRNLIYVQQDSREHQAAELAILSFYLCGMNAVDLYQLPPADESTIDRLNYNRSKTRKRRRDRAFISMPIPDTALPLYIKYAGVLKYKYASQEGLDQALSFGMRRLGEKLNIPHLWFYDFRHAFGDQAHNLCGFSMQHIGLALNHKDNSNKVTEIYVRKNWDTVDKIQKAVLKLYVEEEKCQEFCNPTTMSVTTPFYVRNRQKDGSFMIRY